MRAAIQGFAETANVPVGCAFRRHDLFDNIHPNYAGDVGIGINPKLAQRIKESDLVIVVGCRLDEMTTGGYSLFDVPRPKQKFVHVHPGTDELGKITRPICTSIPASITGSGFTDTTTSSAAVQPFVSVICNV